MKETLGRCYKYCVYDTGKSCDIYCCSGVWLGTVYRGNPDWTITYAHGITNMPFESALRLLGYKEYQNWEIE
jgi:hypothetical protein